MTKRTAIQVGDTWHRVNGGFYDEGCCDVELDWQEFKVVKTTRCGAWLQQEFKVVKTTRCGAWLQRQHFGLALGKPRFILASGGRWACQTKDEALVSLIARKRRHLRILAARTEEAERVLELAKATRAQSAPQPADQPHTP